MRFQVESADGRSVQVEAVDWMIAMVRATEALGVVPSALNCEPGPDGSVRVSDPDRGGSWRIVPLEVPAASLPPASSRAPTPMLAPPRGDPGAVPARPRPYRTPVRKPLWSPDSAPRVAPTGTIEEPPPNLAERLFELSLQVRAEPTARQAAARALSIATTLVGCEAGAVLRGGAEDDAFEFWVVQGGAGESLVGRRVPFHKGLAGAAYDAGVPILVADVARDPRHNRDIDRDTGFTTRAVLCVPVRSELGFHGVVELLNPPPGRSFLAWHVDVVESLAAALAERVNGARPEDGR